LISFINTTFSIRIVLIFIQRIKTFMIIFRNKFYTRFYFWASKSWCIFTELTYFISKIFYFSILISDIILLVNFLNLNRLFFRTLMFWIKQDNIFWWSSRTWFKLSSIFTFFKNWLIVLNIILRFVIKINSCCLMFSWLF
jgi:hypothetical protein